MTAPIEVICDKRIGDIFSTRVAGNYADSGVIGGLEFACAVTGAKVIFVLGHSDCGAIKGACDNVDMGNLNYVIEQLKPAVDSVSGFQNERNSKNKDFVRAVTVKNVELTCDWILQKSKIISDLALQGKVKIVGAVYDVKTGKLDFLD